MRNVVKVVCYIFVVYGKGWNVVFIFENREPLAPVEQSAPVKTVKQNISPRNKVKEEKPIDKQVNTYSPEIDYLSVDEFDQIPK